MNAAKPPTPGPRRVGRPTRDTAEVRAALLDAATAEFATQGIRHARIRQMALAAGSTSAMVSYYFGGKQGLVDAVFEERVLPFLAAVRERAANPDLPPIEVLRALITAMGDTAARTPWLPRLVLREVYMPEGALRAPVVRGFGRGMARRLLELVARAQRDGALRRDQPPAVLVYAFLSLAVYPLISLPVLGDLLALSPEERRLDRLAACHFEVFLSGAGA